MKQDTNHSEVARLLAQIEAEYTAAQRGMTGFAVGAAHAAITARMENIGRIHERLKIMVGDEAIKLVAECLDNITPLSLPTSSAQRERREG